MRVFAVGRGNENEMLDKSTGLRIFDLQIQEVRVGRKKVVLDDGLGLARDTLVLR